MTWHASPRSIEAYLAGALDQADAASLEAHTTACPTCLAVVAERVDAAPLELMWAEVLDVIDAGRDPLLVRGLRRLGVADATARLVAATSAMSVAWLAGTILALALALFLAVVSDGAALFLLVAPVVPLLGVAAGYGPALEASREMTVAMPYPAFRLLAVRSLAVVVTSLVAGTSMGLVLPGSFLVAVSWLLPAMVLSLAAFALLGRLSPLATAAVLGTGWLLAVGLWAEHRHDELAAFRPLAQVVWAGCAVVALIAGLSDRDRFETLGGTA